MSALARTLGSSTRQPAPTRDLAAAAVVAAVVGGVAAASAYLVHPAALPVAAVLMLGFAVGLARLEWGVAFLILAAPFAETAPITQPGQAPVRVAIVAWTAALAAAHLVRALWGARELSAPPLMGPAVLFIASAVLSVPVAPEGGDAASKALLLAGSVAVFVMVAALDDWRRLRVVLGALLVAGLAIALHALFQYFTGEASDAGVVTDTGDVEYRVASFFSHPNQLAGFLALFVPLAGGLAMAYRPALAKAASAVVLAVAATAVVLTLSRGALVALAAAALILLRNPRTLPLGIGGALGIVLLAPSLVRERLLEAGTTEVGDVAGRTDLWDAALGIFASHPVLGYGLDNFGEAYLELERPGRAFVSGEAAFSLPDTAHNLYLNVLAEQGLFGALALGILFVGFLSVLGGLRRSAERRTRAVGYGLLGAFVVLLFHNVFDVTFLDPKTSIIVWSLIGIAAALVRADAISSSPASGDDGRERPEARPEGQGRSPAPRAIARA